MLAQPARSLVISCPITPPCPLTHPLRFDQIHSQSFFTFRDFYEEGEVPEFTNMHKNSVLKVN